MPVPLWAGKYIGLPFKARGRERTGMDCWGLVRLVMREQFGLFAPSYDEQYEDIISSIDFSTIGDLVGREVKLWNEIGAGDEHLGHMIVMVMRGHPMHVGIVLGDGYMLHIERGVNSCIEKYNSLKWRNRIYGFFEYAIPQDKT